jgi:DNA-binding transcriptional LysR family regulator
MSGDAAGTWPTVELREMRVFLTLAEELHYGRTAERLLITPARVSQTIQTLEAKVGSRLFDRTSRKVKLTPMGEEVRHRISPVCEALDLAWAEVHELASGISGRLRLGVYAHAAGEPHLMEIIRTFEARHPDCSVRVTETGLGRDPLDWLRRGELDMLILRPVSDRDIELGPILDRQPRVLAVAVDHPLAGRDSVCVEDLADFTTTDVPTIPREIMDVFSPARTPSGRPIRRAALHSIAEAAVRVATGELVHPTVPWFFERYPDPGVVGVPIRDLPAATTALMWLKHNRSAKLMAFADAATEILSTSAASQGARQRVSCPTRFSPV